jgi:hypothetical protein
VSKTLNINIKKDKIAFFDESSHRIEWNVRRFYPKGEKNIRKVSSKRIRLNSIGALVPNGNSYISFPEKINAFTLPIFILEFLKENTTDDAISKEIDSVLNMENTKMELVEHDMKLELVSDGDELFKKIEAIKLLNIPSIDKKEKLDKLLRKFSVSSKKLFYRLRFNQLNNVNNSNLYKKFNDFVIVWDNAKPHIAIHVKNILEYLGVKIIPLPVKSPKYNPIEYPWKDVKRETAKEPIDSEIELKNFVEKEFYDVVNKNNYSDYWFKLIEEKRKKYFEELGISIII